MMVILDAMIYIYRERFLDNSSSLTKIRSILGFIQLCKEIAQRSGYYYPENDAFTLI